MSLLLIAALLAAHPPNLRGIFTANDVPFDLLTPNKPQTVAIAVTVGPDGNVLACSIEETSGNQNLDSYTCNLAARRAKFPQSTTYLVRRTRVFWWVGDGYPPKSDPADLAFTIPTLPANLHSPTFVKLMFDVDERGNISGCKPETERESAVLASIACGQMAKAFRPRPAQTKEGNPVPSRQNATVKFQGNEALP